MYVCFRLCHAWPGVVFCSFFNLISVGLHFAQFSLFPRRSLFFFKKEETEVHLSRGFSGRMARITGGGRGLGHGGREGVERNIHFSFL